MDRTRLDLFRDRKSTDYKYVPRVIEKQDDHVHNKHNLGASPPLVSRVFLPGKRRAAQIASCDLGSVCLFVTFCVARTEAFLMTSNTVIIDVFRVTRHLKHLAALTPISGVRAAPCLIFTW